MTALNKPGSKNWNGALRKIPSESLVFIIGIEVKRMLFPYRLTIRVLGALGNIAIAACSSSTMASETIQLNATTDVTSPTNADPQLQITVTVKNTGDQPVLIHDLGCPIPIHLYLYHDASHLTTINWNPVSPVCPLILLQPSSLAPGDAITFARIFSDVPRGAYYGVATVWAADENRSIDLGRLVVP